MAENRMRVSTLGFFGGLLCVEAIGFVQGSDPKTRASVDVQSETTRFEVVLRNTDSAFLKQLAGSSEEWLTRREALLFAKGFAEGLVVGKTGVGE